MPRRLFRRIFKVTLLLCVMAVVWAAWYGAKRGLTRNWREVVFAEFRAQGVEITFKKLTADALRGFVARDVTIFDADDHQRVLAEIDKLTLNVDWSRLLRRRSFVSALELHNARLSLPLNRRDPKSQRVEVEHLQARLLFPEHQIRLVHAEASTLGFDVSAEGWLSNPVVQESTPGESPRWLPVLERVLQEIRAVQWKGNSPQLHLQFTGDMNVPESVSAHLRIQSGGAILRGYPLESLVLSAAWKDGALELEELSIEDKGGHLHGVARIGSSGEYEARAESTLEPTLLVKAVGGTLPESWIQFEQRPAVQLQAKGGGVEHVGLQVTARAQVRGFSIKQEHFEGLDAAGSWEEGRWSLRGMRLVHKLGSLTADAMSAPEDFRLQISSTLPLALFELALPDVSPQGPLRWLQSKEPPRIELEARGSAPKLESCAVWGKVEVAKAVFRGVPLERLISPFSFKGGVWSFGSLQLRRSEGMGEGSVTYDAVHNDLFFHDLQLRLNPVDVMKMIEPEWVEEVSPYVFKGDPPFVTIRGKAAPHTPDRTNLQVEVKSKTGMDYEFAGKTLSFDQVVAKLLFTPRKVQITAMDGELFHGHISGNVEIALKPNSSPHKASMYVTEVDFAPLSHLYTGYDESKGKLNATFLWKGDGDNARLVDGSGELSITDGNVFAIPFLGPISGVLNSIQPGLGMSNAHKATATFTVKNGVFNTQDLHIDGAGFSLFGRGDLFFMDDTMQFYARINARGLPGLLLFPVSKLFEYESNSKLSKPGWKPRILPKGEKPPADIPAP
jgi:hypothetical protein